MATALTLLVGCTGGSDTPAPNHSVEVSAPSLTFTAQEFSYPAPAAQTVHATYTLDAMVVGWPMSRPVPTWLNYSASRGSGKSVDVMIQPNSTSVTGNPYRAPYDLNGWLRFATGTGTVDESHYSAYIDLPITLHITPGLSINPVDQHISATHGSNPASGSYILGISASLGVSWTITTDQPWLIPAPASGTGISYSAKVDFATTSLPVGSYVGTVSVQSTDGSLHKSVKIYLTVN